MIWLAPTITRLQRFTATTMLAPIWPARQGRWKLCIPSELTGGENNAFGTRRRIVAPGDFGPAGTARKRRPKASRRGETDEKAQGVLGRWRSLGHSRRGDRRLPALSESRLHGRCAGGRAQCSN